jgi:hypothetical protein
MSQVWRITGKNSTDDSDYTTEDEARAGLRSPFLGKTGEWLEDRDDKGNLKVTFVERTASGSEKGKTSWKIKSFDVADQ